jgi:CheY-like chemotaxis protein
MALIVVAEDNGLHALLLRDFLAAQGYEVSVVQDAGQFAAEIEKRCPDAAIVDMQMPAGGGVAAVRALRERYANAQVPVIVCSVMPPEEVGKWFPGVTGLTILQKPPKLDLLGEELKSLLGR